MEPETTIFQLDIQSNMDVALYTRQKSTRPWLGRVLSLLADGKDLFAEIPKFKCTTRFPCGVPPGPPLLTAKLWKISPRLPTLDDKKTEVENCFSEVKKW